MNQVVSSSYLRKRTRRTAGPKANSSWASELLKGRDVHYLRVSIVNGDRLIRWHLRNRVEEGERNRRVRGRFGGDYRVAYYS